MKGRLMDIFAFAIEKERNAEHHYRRLADRAGNAGLKSILNMLAEEEVQHVRIVESIKAQRPVKIAETSVLKDAKEVFVKMKESAEQFDFDMSEIDLYRKACDFEAESKKYYLEKAGEVQDAGQKALFMRLAEEENKHLVLVQSLCDFVARAESFLEDAEFYHFDDYVEDEF